MASRTAHSGTRILASACRHQHRAFSSSPIPSAFSNSSSYRAATTSAPKPAAKPTTSTYSRSPNTQRTTPPATSSSASLADRTVTPSFPATEPPPPTARSTTLDSANAAAQSQRSLTDGLFDQPPELENVPAIDWTRSYHGLGSVSFTPEQSDILLAPITPEDVEVKPDGIIYLPEIKYRRILNRAFGPGGWGLAPRGESIVTGKLVTREYGLIVQGRLVSIARGEQQYFDPDGIPTATEGCKSNALMRCCKDLGIASELWDPRFIRKFMVEMTKEVWVEHVATKKKRKVVIRKDDVVKYPFKESKAGFA
ncbi:Mgm101p-domain-containing protein [Sporormia fimetaria CBS 119925]|uniref:Mitochondrial genome maintenance protein MGM101 n=1 Tax=Sporormia fimetaria CBS 119925 TaxID=1340428 RepID=A0A6A6V5F4_9PLEO|nr:Mgm101p-domain-containing protein [Sporormia fimetaria CBS 119925]